MSTHGNHTVIYTDGSSIGNPGYGGRAAVVLQDDQQITLLSDGYTDVTNNQMELMGAISALQWCTEQNIAQVNLITDSQYVKNGIESWIINRRRNGRRTAARKPVLNQGLWKELDRLTGLISVKRGWTKGHADNKRNNLVDQTAFAESSKQKSQYLPTFELNQPGGLFG